MTRHCSGGTALFSKEKTNVCKGVGILFLIFHHLFRTPSLIESQHFRFFFLSVEWASIIATALRVCVWIFAFLSAYGLTYKYIHLPKEKRGQFVPRQWLSLMKPFWFVFIIAIVIALCKGVNPMATYNYKVTYLLADFFAVSDFFGTPKMLGVFWYMCFAQMMILLIPLFVKLCGKLGYLSIPVAYVVMQFLGEGIVTVNGGGYVEYLVVVICGVVFAQKDLMNRLAQKELSVPKRLTAILVMLVLFLGALSVRELLLTEDVRHLRGVCSAVGAVSICMLFGVYIRVGWLDKALGFLGKYSGTMFLLHSMLYSMLPMIVYVSDIAVLVFLLLTAESLAAAVLLTYIKKWIRYDRWFIVFEKLIDKIKINFV